MPAMSGRWLHSQRLARLNWMASGPRYYPGYSCPNLLEDRMSQQLRFHLKSALLSSPMNFDDLVKMVEGDGQFVWNLGRDLYRSCGNEISEDEIKAFRDQEFDSISITSSCASFPKSSLHWTARPPTTRCSCGPRAWERCDLMHTMRATWTTRSSISAPISPGSSMNVCSALI